MGRVNPHIVPGRDGVDHINMYSKAKTEFGRMLSNFAPFHFRTDAEGEFYSIEGYWYFLSMPEDFARRDELRSVYGFAAKSKGRELRLALKREGRATRFDPQFQEKICAAIRAKIHANAAMLRPEHRGLPVWHYYVLNDGRPYDMYDDFPWMMECINEEIRKL